MTATQIIAPTQSREEAQQLILAQVTRKIVGLFGADLSALILTGSIARGEGSLLLKDGKWWVLGDAEFLVVLRDGARLLSTRRFSRVAQEMSGVLERLGIICSLDFSAVHADYFLRMRPHIFGYELRTCGKTLWGDPEVLHSLPSFSASEIPKEDAWRLLCNRMIEQLRVLGEIHTEGDLPIEKMMHSCNKFFLDLGTSLLIFLGEYEPTYQLRAEKLSRLAHDANGSGLPFSLVDFSRQATKLTAFRLRPETDPCIGAAIPSAAAQREALLRRWLEAVPYARRLWDWEIAALVGEGERGASLDEQWARFLRAQSSFDKLKGWLHLFSRSEYRFSYTRFKDVLRLIATASPRYLTYAAASHLYFSAPQLLGPEGGGSLQVPARAKRLLPIQRRSRGDSSAWGDVRQDVVWLYEQFLVRTRH